MSTPSVVLQSGQVVPTLTVSQLKDMKRPIASRRPTGKVLFVENFASTTLSMYNDGAGLAYRDSHSPFMNYPSARLDSNGSSVGFGVTNPGGTPNTGGVIFKHRIVQTAKVGKFGMEAWFWPSSANIAQSLFSMSIYNRDGVNNHIGRLFLDFTQGTGVVRCWFLSSTSPVTYTALTPDLSTDWQNITNDPGGAASTDRSGAWFYLWLGVDFDNNKYLGLQVNDNVFDTQVASTLLPNPVDSATKGALHFSFEFASQSTVRRYCNVAQVTALDMS